MKRILIVLFAFSLSGCALFDAYFMAKYDTTEYALVNEIKTKAQIAEENCGNHLLVVTQVNELYIKSLEFKNFTMHIPRICISFNQSKCRVLRSTFWRSCSCSS